MQKDLNDLQAKYCNAIIKELKYHVECLSLFNRTCSSIYFGGGTPFLFSTETIGKIIAAVGENLLLSENSEITIEANPDASIDNLLESHLLGLKQAGVNRISIGAQGFCKQKLKVLGRIHSVSSIITFYQSCLNSGFRNIGLDLIFAVPNETLKSWESDLETAIKLSPSHISAYCLTIEKQTPYAKLIEEGVLQIPSEEIQRKMMMLCMNKLKEAGYQHYEISNYSKPNYESRHNLSYWKREPYLGLGASAHSFVNSTRWCNTNSVEKYLSMMELCEHARVSKEHIDSHKERLEKLMLGLRCFHGLDVTDLIADCKEQLRLGFNNQLDLFIEQGLVLKSPQGLKLTTEGILLADHIISCLAEKLS